MNEEIVQKFKEAQTCLVRLEKQLKNKKLQIKYKESEIRQLRFIMSTKQNLDINSILSTYKQQFPFHKPFIYWKSLINILSTFNQTELKKALKSHDISKYVKWQIQPPK